MDGWLKLHRKLLESKQFLNPLDLKIWIWLLCKVSTQERHLTLKVGNGLQVVSLELGQMIFGRTTAERELKIAGTTIYKVLQRMASDEAIIINSNNHFSIITLTNWTDYQCYEKVEDFEIIEDGTAGSQPEVHKATATGQQSDSHGTQYKKVNKGKKVKTVKKVEENGASAVPPPLNASPEFAKFYDWIEKNCPRVNRMKEPFTEQQFEEVRKEWPPETVRDMLKQMHNWEPLTRKNRSANLTILNWLKKDKNNATHRTTNPAGGTTKQGTSAARVEALRNWGHTGTRDGTGG